jgi:hypothetical protein
MHTKPSLLSLLFDSVILVLSLGAMRSILNDPDYCDALSPEPTET